MGSNQVMLVLFCGEVWNSLSTAIPEEVSTNRSNAYTSTTSAVEDKAPPHQVQTTGPSSHTSGAALAVITPAQVPRANTEPSEGSWIPALVIGIILVGMIIAIMIILVWNRCKKSAPADSNWAGPSPFADGDTPDVFMDSDQATRRSSIFFMLPWKLKQDTNLLQDSTAEEPSPCPTSNSQLPPPDQGCSAAPVSVSNVDASPAANSTGDSCPDPATSPEAPDLPPPPDWLKKPTDGHSSDPSKYQKLHSEAEEPLPPPPELLTAEAQEPLPPPPL
ncbi:EVI2B protein, partial [Brachypteracias leptosomus]|nr:EVI2B protein [Brachypteracias leptosomus]